jgi:hypothetical protein
MTVYRVKFHTFWLIMFFPFNILFGYIQISFIYFFYKGCLRFYGKGAIYMQDTSLIFKGDIAKFYLPIFSWFFQKVVCIPTIRSIPYSIILKYKPPSFFRRFHFIKYQLPDGKKGRVIFRMTKTDSSSFSDELEKYRNISKEHSIH